MWKISKFMMENILVVDYEGHMLKKTLVRIFQNLKQLGNTPSCLSMERYL